MKPDILEETDRILRDIRSLELEASLARNRRAVDYLIESAAQSATSVSWSPGWLYFHPDDPVAEEEWARSVLLTEDGLSRTCTGAVDCTSTYTPHEYGCRSRNEGDPWWIPLDDMDLWSPWEGMSVAMTANNRDIFDNPPDGVKPTY